MVKMVLLKKSFVNIDESPAGWLISIRVMLITRYCFSDTDLNAEVDRCLELRAEYKTVVQRAQLAQTFFDLGKKELTFCDKLVHEQHLQHQGWMAVIANMEDITTEFQERCNDFDKVFKDHIEKRMEYKDYLERLVVKLSLQCFHNVAMTTTDICQCFSFAASMRTSESYHKFQFFRHSCKVLRINRFMHLMQSTPTQMNLSLQI